MDTDKIAEIIHHWASDQALLIEALAVEFWADPDNCHPETWHRRWAPDGQHSGDYESCKACHWFDRTAWVAKATP